LLPRPSKRWEDGDYGQLSRDAKGFAITAIREATGQLARNPCDVRFGSRASPSGEGCGPPPHAQGNKARSGDMAPVKRRKPPRLRAGTLPEHNPESEN
jgi:hypothetical protein